MFAEDFKIKIMLLIKLKTCLEDLKENNFTLIEKGNL